MYRALATAALGFQVPFGEAAQLAAKHGFEGIAVSIQDILGLGMSTVSRLLDRHDLIPALTGLPVNFREDDESFDRDMGELRGFCEAMASLGCTRVATWLRPWHPTLAYAAHFEQLRQRTARICDELAAHGLRYGLEYVGPETARRGKPNPFIYNTEGLLSLIRAVGADNLGFMLDTYHWYTSGDTTGDLDKLSNQLAVVVHVNDAPAGVTREEQLDLVRAMPGETGVIDTATFMGALRRMAYDGPVVVEPFCKWLRELSVEEAVGATARALDLIWESV